MPDTVFLCFNAPMSEAYTLANAWWGAGALSTANAAYQSGTRPDYSGLLAVAAKRIAEAAGAMAIATVIEFGTSSPVEAGRCLWIDRWLRHAPKDADSTAIEALRLRARRFFYPDDPAWRQGVLEKGGTIIDQAYPGLKDWSSAA